MLLLVAAVFCLSFWSVMALICVVIWSADIAAMLIKVLRKEKHPPVVKLDARNCRPIQN